jgi:hypothetical protein
MFNFVQIWKRLCILVLSIWVVSVTTSSAESDPKRLPGKVVVANVTGKAEAVDPENQSSQILKKNDIITEKHTVRVGAASTATLVFSNGASINLLENSSLIISQFLQDPFSLPYTTAIVTEEPTTSVTKLNLVKGEVVCNVKKLRTKEGSSLVVNTPVGAAGVRGTTFAVSYVPDPTGGNKWIYTLSVTEGEVALTDDKGNVTLVTAGKEVVITVRVLEDPRDGTTTVIELLETVIRDIPEDRRNMINEQAAKGSDAALIFYVDVMEFEPHDVINHIRDLQPVITPPKPVTPMDP